MSLGEKLVQIYFDLAYNPAYDITTGRLNLYRQLQSKCVAKLELTERDRVLCVGCGTGNEIFHILQVNRKVHVIGIDYSKTALHRIQKKSLSCGRKIQTILMDAQHLEFANGSFDKVLCLHLMDFVADHRQVTKEIMRVLGDGGRFVITYPSGKEGAQLGLNILKDIIRSNMDSGKHFVRALLESIIGMTMGAVYFPLILRQKTKAYTRHELEAMIAGLTNNSVQIEEEPMYHDFIVCGNK